MGVRARPARPLSASERAVLEELVGTMGPRLLAYVHRVYGNLHDAEDIVAETFSRAAGNVAALQASGRPDLYLLTVARNLCRDAFRRARPAPTAPDRLQQVAASRPCADESLASSEQTEALRAAVAALPQNLREVVILRMSSGLKFEEIAQFLQIPLGTALSRMHTALQFLRTALGAHA